MSCMMTWSARIHNHFRRRFIAHRDFLWRTIPLFHEPRVGLVQTAQHFFNRDPIQSNLLVGHVWPDE